MGFEIETKVLEVNPRKIRALLKKLKAKKILKSQLFVSWFRTKGSKEGQDDWYLRIRTYRPGKSEITWKGKSTVTGAGRKHQEINMVTEFPDQMADLFIATGLERYAYQEKDRQSWQLKDWKFDMDTYPGMPTYLEIETTSEKKIQEGLKLLNLQNHKTSSEGERILIQKEYGLNWYDMRYKNGA